METVDQQAPDHIHPPHIHWGIIICLVIIFVLTGILGLTLYQMRPELQQAATPPPLQTIPTATPTPETGPTAGWKEFVDRDNQYSFRYPPNWFASACDSAGIDLIPQSKECVATKSATILFVRTYQKPASEVVSLLKATQGKEYNIEDRLTMLADEPHTQLRYLGKTPESSPSAGRFNEAILTFFPKDTKTHILWYIVSEKSPISTLNLILSSLRLH